MLSHVRECQIYGLVDSEYKVSILQQICRQDWSMDCFLHKVISLTDAGKHACVQSRFASAIEKYRLALKELLLNLWHLHSDRCIPDGEFAGHSYTVVMHRYLSWQLSSNIVAAHLKLH